MILANHGPRLHERGAGPVQGRWSGCSRRFARVFFVPGGRGIVLIATSPGWIGGSRARKCAPGAPFLFAALSYTGRTIASRLTALSPSSLRSGWVGLPAIRGLGCYRVPARAPRRHEEERIRTRAPSPGRGRRCPLAQRKRRAAHRRISRWRSHALASELEGPRHRRDQKRRPADDRVMDSTSGA